jgi:hypothetical protein
MAINLKEILINDSANVVLDKLNYNFDQIMVNGGGPMGAQGAQGIRGFDGLTGDTGDTGAPGLQGPAGEKGDPGQEFWKVNVGANNNTIVPIHDHTAKPNAPTVMVGVDKNDPLYDVVLQESSLLINKKTGLHNYNIQLLDDGVTNDNGNFAYINIDLVGDKTVKTESFSSLTNTVNKKVAAKHIFSDGANELVTIDADLLEANVATNFNEGVTITAPLQIHVGTPALNKILAGTDSLGNATWKNISEIGGAVPVGTIVPVLTDIFDNPNNFEQGAFLPSDASPLHILYGRGKGAYKGWYISNGKNWIDGAGVSYSTKDLCSFSYKITNNTERPSGQGQGPIEIINSILALNGGADLGLDATYESVHNEYTITTNLNTANELIYPGSSGVAMDLYKMVHIVYLGHDNLYWEDAGDQGEIINNLVIASVTMTSSTNPWDSCAGYNSNVYDISIPPTNETYASWIQHQVAGTKAEAWRDVDLNYEGPTGKVYLYQTGTTLPAADGYYTVDGYVRYVNAGVIFDNLFPAPCLENGDAQTCILPTAAFDSVGGPSNKSMIVNETATLYSAKSLPAWRNTSQLTHAYQWQMRTGSNGMSNISGATSSTYVIPTSGTYALSSVETYYFRVGIVTLDAATGTQSSIQYSPEIVANVGAAYTFFGGTMVSDATTLSTNGSLSVSGTSTITLRTTRSFSSGGTGSSQLIISGGSQNYTLYGDVDANNPQQILTVQVPAGNYSYTLAITSGTSTNRTASIY